MSEYDIGDSVTLTATFRSAGVLTNPTVVTLRVRNPAGTITTPAFANPSTGLYTATLTFIVDGVWEWGWKGTGAVASAEPGRAYVRRSRVLV